MTGTETVRLGFEGAVDFGATGSGRAIGGFFRRGALCTLKSNAQRNHVEPYQQHQNRSCRAKRGAGAKPAATGSLCLAGGLVNAIEDTLFQPFGSGHPELRDLFIQPPQAFHQIPAVGTGGQMRRQLFLLLGGKRTVQLCAHQRHCFFTDHYLSLPSVEIDVSDSILFPFCNKIFLNANRALESRDFTVPSRSFNTSAISV